MTDQKNYDTTNFSNVLDIDNWVVVGQALMKMAGFFWPVIVIIAILAFIEYRKETNNATN